MSASSRNLRISDVLFFAWDVLWVASFFLTDRGAFAHFFDFAAVAVAAASFPFVVLGDVTAIAVYLLVFLAGVANFTGASALLAYMNDPSTSVSRLQALLTATAPVLAGLLWGSANESIRASAQTLRRPGNLSAADPVRVLLASLMWVPVPVVFFATYSFDVHRALFQSALCSVSSAATSAPSPSPGAECGVDWVDGCECSLLFLRHLAVVALGVVCFNILLLLEILRTPNRPGVVLVG